MDEKIIEKLKKLFDDIVYLSEDKGMEFWYARELQPLLGYSRWENFELVINKAMTSCKNSESSVTDHFRDVTNMVSIGSGAVREVKEYALTRYVCYLIAQNGDSRKEEIAFAQSYFAVQTRKQEIIEDRIIYFENGRDVNNWKTLSFPTTCREVKINMDMQRATKGKIFGCFFYCRKERNKGMEYGIVGVIGAIHIFCAIKSGV